MVKTKREYVLASSITSAIALALSITSLTTTEWINAKGKFIFDQTEEVNDINYGLFSGTLTQRMGNHVLFPIYVKCLISENICGYLCNSEISSQDILKQLYNNEKVNFETCKVAPNTSISTRSSTKAGDRKFINAGVFISTVTFLGISAIFGFLSVIFSIWNTVGNPIEVVFSLYGVFIYNTIACFSMAIAVILWGVLYATTLIDNICMYYTIQGDIKEDEINLGYSYWMTIPSFVLYAASVIILFFRERVIRQSPEIKIHITANERDVGDIMNF